MFRPLNTGLARTLVLGCAVSWVGAQNARAGDTVVVYSSLDREFSEPVLKAYGEQTKIRVLPKFDVESTKTVGLTNLIIAESRRPRCDLFWNNEILNTLAPQGAGFACAVPSAPRLGLARDLQGQRWHVVRLRGAGPHLDRQHEACRGGQPAQGDSRSDSIRGGKGRSASPSPSSAPPQPTRHASSPPGVTRRRKPFSAH